MHDDDTNERPNANEMPDWVRAAKHNHELAEHASRLQFDAQRAVDNAIVNFEAERSALASVYASTGANNIAEHAVGEALTQIRKALSVLRKSAAELAQQPLPMK